MTTTEPRIVTFAPDKASDTPAAGSLLARLEAIRQMTPYGTPALLALDSLIRDLENPPELTTAEEEEISTENLLQQILATLERMEQRPATSADSRSSVVVKTSTRGHDVEVKSYGDGMEDQAANAALATYARTMRDLTALAADGFKATVDALRAEKNGEQVGG